MKYLCLLVPETGMAHLRFGFFFSEQRQKVNANGNFFVRIRLPEKSQRGRGELGTYSFKKLWNYQKHIFSKSPGISRFVSLPLEIIDKRKLHSWRLQKFVLHSLEIPHFFLITPGYSTCAYYFFNTPGNSMPSTPRIFSVKAHCTLFKVIKIYKVFFLIIFSDVSSGSLGIPLPIPKDTNMKSGSKLNIGNYLVGEITRTFVYIAYKGKIYFLKSK